jgi:hypothetical protein
MNVLPAVQRHAHACPYPRPLPIAESFTLRGPAHGSGCDVAAWVMRCRCGWFLWVAA